MSNAADIKRGVSLYSFQEEYFLRKLDLEGAIATAAELGAFGIETLAEQMMPGFPNLSDEFYETWHEWMRKYGTTATAHDMFLDTKRFKDRLLTDNEMVESVKRDILHAERIGARVIRVLVITPPHIVEAAAPFAKEHGVVLAVEVHSPWSLDSDWITEHIAVAKRVGTDVVGIIPDLGIFVRRFPRVISERHVRDGAHREIVDRIVQAYDAGEDVSKLRDEVTAMGANEDDLRLAETVTHFINLDPAALADYMPYIVHIHGKFYEMTDEGEEYSIPYPEIIAVLKEHGYQGWISSEYEGNRHIQDAFEVDSVEQVRRHQNMLRRLIDAD